MDGSDDRSGLTMALTPTPDAELEIKWAMLSSLSLVDSGLRDFSGHDLLPSSEVLDLLLDIRGELAAVAAETGFDEPS